MPEQDKKYPATPSQGDLDKALPCIEQLLTQQSLGILATCGEQEPHASIVGFAAEPDLHRIYFATPRATRKYRNLLYCGRAALLVDNRSNQLADFHEARAVTANGTVVELKEGDMAEALATYSQRHPHLSEFVRSPSCALFVIKVAMYRFVNRFQEVTELHFD